MRSVIVIAAAMSGFGALAQDSPISQPPAGDNQIPNWGGALRFEASERENLPYALDAGWKGEKVCEPLFENEHMRAARCTFPPGVGHERHYHPPHFGYIVEGGVMQITDTNGTREQPTPKDGTWWSDGVAWHEAVNIGETTTTYIIIEPKSAGEQ